MTARWGEPVRRPAPVAAAAVPAVTPHADMALLLDRREARAETPVAPSPSDGVSPVDALRDRREARPSLDQPDDLEET